MTSRVIINTPNYKITSDLGRLFEDFDQTLANNYESKAFFALSRFRKRFLNQNDLDLNKRKGGLGKSSMWPIVFQKKQARTKDDVVAELYTRSEAALLHEVGGTVEAKGNSRMAIASSSSKSLSRTPTGKVKKKYRNPGKVMRELSSQGKLRVMPIKPGSDVLVASQKTTAKALKNRNVRSSRRGGGSYKAKDKYLPIYILIPRARFDARLGFIQEWNKFQEEASEIIGEAIDDTLAGKNRTRRKDLRRE